VLAYLHSHIRERVRACGQARARVSESQQEREFASASVQTGMSQCALNANGLETELVPITQSVIRYADYAVVRRQMGPSRA
jgi:hypothetical protein